MGLELFGITGEFSQIFKDREYLSSKIIPEELPHREKEMKLLGYQIGFLFKNQLPSNICIFGSSGIGKTATILKLVNEARKVIENNAINSRIAYTVADRTETKTLIAIAEDLEVDVPSYRGVCLSEVRDTLKKEIEGKKTLIIIDEIDKLILKGKCNDLLYFLTRTPNLALFTISNVFTILDSVTDSRILSSWNPRKIIFERYNANQLVDILRQRVSRAFYDGVVPDDAINFIAAIAAQRGGDARYALDLLTYAGEVLVDEGGSQLSQKHVEKAMVEVEKTFIRKSIRSLTIYEKILFLVVAKNNWIPPSRAYTKANDTLKKIRHETLSDRRWSDYRNELDLAGFIELVKKGRGIGRGWGYYLKLKDTLDRRLATRVLEEEIHSDLKKLTGEM